jgi:hypothetical protein
LVGKVCGPQLDAAALKQAEDCFWGGVGAGVITAIAAPEAALPAFQSYVVACLSAKGAAYASQVKVNLWVKTDCEGWHPC